MPVQYTNQVVGYEGSAQGVVIATHSAGNMSQQYPVSSVATASPYYNYDNNQNSKFESPGFNFPATQHPPQQQPNQHYPPPQNPIQQYPPPQYLPQQQTTQSNVIVSDPVYSGQPQTPVVSSFQDPRKEKKKLAVVSIVLFSCVLPITWYTMVFNDYGDIYIQGTVDIILRSIFYWLSIFRSFITPIIWISSSRK
uniref:Uncharacterized protein n=1 Tax=Arion vulgaris TaxID=1028688 RepID=A0A0B6ZJC2_9EUPU